MNLQIGDKIKRFNLSYEYDTVYEVISLTKTLAKVKSSNNKVFKIQVETAVKTPNENFIGEVIPKEKMYQSQGRYFLLKRS